MLTAPSVAQLRAAIDGPVEVHYLTKRAFAAIPSGMIDTVDHVHSIDRSTNEIIHELKALEFDYIIDLHNNLRSRRVKRALSGLAFTVEKRNLAKWLLVRGWRSKPIPHIVDRYATVTSAFSPEPPMTWPSLFDSASDVPRKGLCIAVGAAHAGKRIPIKTLQTVVLQLYEKYGDTLTVTLIGGENDSESARSIVGSQNRVIDLTGKTSIEESAKAVAQSKAVLAGDTGMMHVAAAVRTPVVAVWGCTRPSLGMAAWKPALGSVNLEPVGRGDRPCSKLGDRCRHSNPCTGHVSPERILDALEVILNA